MHSQKINDENSRCCRKTAKTKFYDDDNEIIDQVVDAVWKQLMKFDRSDDCRKLKNKTKTCYHMLWSDYWMFKKMIDFYEQRNWLYNLSYYLNRQVPQ